MVDQAWGAHLGFAPGIPQHAFQAGADAMVTSAHKMLPAFSQASLVLASTERIDADRLERAFEATHTTSPSGAILASIDASRAFLGSADGQICPRGDDPRWLPERVTGCVLLASSSPDLRITHPDASTPPSSSCTSASAGRSGLDCRT